MKFVSKGIAIVGSGRSGTSFLIKVLHANGVYTGNCIDPTGTLENLDVRHVNDAYLADNFSAIKNSGKPYGILPKEEIIVNNEAQSKAKQAIDNLKRNGIHWAFKDPRTTLLHDMWIKHVDYIVGVYRNPYEVATSYMKLLGVYYTEETKQEGFDIMLDYWQRFNQSLLYLFETSDKPKIMFEFNDNVDNQINKLFEDLELMKYNNSLDFNRTLKHENITSEIKQPELNKTWVQLQKWRVK